MPYKFLTDEWVGAAEDPGRGGCAYDGPQPVKMNLVITEVPFGEGTVEAHMDTTNGTVELELGLLDTADVTATLDYDTAKEAMMVDANPQAGMQAFMAGKISSSRAT